MVVTRQTHSEEQDNKDVDFNSYRYSDKRFVRLRLMKKVEIYQYESELWINTDGKQERLEEGSAYVDKIYSELSVNYPKALDCLMGMYKEAANNQSYYRFLIVRRFCKCNFAMLDNKLDIDNGVFNFEHISCPLRGECKGENVVCHPEFNTAISVSERRVLEMLYNGYKCEEIADKLYISVFTVRNHIKNAYRRLGVHSEAEFMRYAQTHNIFKS